ncbi:uncharacterized protein BDR25DRAFT_267440 [Lindgomyces ingoldianus]|uniref:Uncharacterized protein n=1 Tax=Lindgomyces ingoldianus TaxID=673940 RepID=A0ACB6QL46_9PLEO|nr:uncharacterized protein BDR25DRAFT_267440 [Lindgomyces ingoldianus]KAF2467303.1 hypothetical protein BDR25DRAFT_267440 [Lindgomyces ingoldianus]
MLVDDTDKTALKQWVTLKLTEISEADPEVLADYVIALLTADESEHFVKEQCLEALPDFLPEHAVGPFVNDIFDAVKTRSYLPAEGRDEQIVQSIPPLLEASTPSADSAATLSAEPTPFNPPTGPSAKASRPVLSAKAPSFNPPTGPSAGANRQQRLPGLGSAPENDRAEKSRKRSYNDRAGSEARNGLDAHYKRGVDGDRPIKQVARRGGRNSRGGFVAQEGNRSGTHGTGPVPNPMSAMSNLSTLPNLTSVFPPFDPTDPMSFLAMSALGLGIPGMSPPIPLTGLPPAFSALKQFSPNNTFIPTSLKERCQDYDTKGFCVRGSACPYEHGGEVLIADEYDPNQASLAIKSTEGVNGSQKGNQGSGRGEFGVRGRPTGRRARAPFSQPGPTKDRSNTTVVVEQIPEDKFSEDAVRSFFSHFGRIVNIEMHAYKRLAIVKFGDHFAARRAYDSPKAIFDNRFVKVYWYNPESIPAPQANSIGNCTAKPSSPLAAPQESYTQDEEMVDLAEIEKRQAELQKAHEERVRKQQEAEAQCQEVEKQLKIKNEETMKLRRELAALTGSELKSTESDFVEKLSLLQQEAHTFGIDTDKCQPSPSGRGRGGYRGRATYYSTRGRGYRTFRGGSVARGGFTGSAFANARCGVKRLDNRPKKVAVTGVEAGSEKDEAFRQYLLNNYEYESIEQDAERKNTLVIVFRERYVAEAFIDNARRNEEVGKVELSWVHNGRPGPTPAPAASAAPLPKAEVASAQREHEVDRKMDEHVESIEHADTATDTNGHVNGGDADYDVADDEDGWIES